MSCAPYGVVLFAVLLTACARTTDIYLGADEPVDRRPQKDAAQSGALAPPPTSDREPTAEPDSAAEPPEPPDLGIDAGISAAASDAGMPVDSADAALDAGAAVDAGDGATPACSPGTADCDSDDSNGCETDVATDLQNCGGCARLCHTGGHDAIDAQCVAGRCELTCRQDLIGDHDCDGDPDNGCETHLLTDNQNCGACGVSCVCANGKCL